MFFWQRKEKFLRMLRTFAQSNRAKSTGRDSARQIVIASENKNIEKTLQNGTICNKHIDADYIKYDRKNNYKIEL